MLSYMQSRCNGLLVKRRQHLFSNFSPVFCASRVELFTRYVFKSHFPNVFESSPKIVYAQIKSFLLFYGAVNTTINNQGVVGVYGKGHWGVSFCVGRCVLRKLVVGGGRFDGYFGEQGLPVGIQECLETFHRRCLDYRSRQFVPKWDSPNGEGELATARTASLLVELECVAT